MTLGCLSQGQAQQAASIAPTDSTDDLRIRVQQLEREVTELRQIVKQLQPRAAGAAVSNSTVATVGVLASAGPPEQSLTGGAAVVPDRKSVV